MRRLAIGPNHGFPHHGVAKMKREENVRTIETNACRVMVRWGVDGSCADGYEFGSPEELAAFLKGVDEGCGWLEYEIVDQSLTIRDRQRGTGP